MGSIKRSFLPVLLFCFPLLFLAGQSPGSGSLSGEIQRIEKLLEDSRISGRERREALIGLARLWALSGSRERAAEAWIEAAFAEPGYRDDASLLEGTRCLIALGEFEKAGANVTAILQTGRDMAAQNRARYLGAWIEAFRTGNTGTLASFPDDPEYSSEGSALLYTLWKISGGESWKIRLEIDYPESPEARIARGGGPVGGKPTAMWLLMAGRDQIGVAEPVRVSPPAAPAAPQTAAKDGPVTLQTGLFGREENAKAMAERLKNAGFTPEISRRRINETLYWAVQVEPGRDLNATILGLKNAGFESFPVY